MSALNQHQQKQAKQAPDSLFPPVQAPAGLKQPDRPETGHSVPVIETSLAWPADTGLDECPVADHQVPDDGADEYVRPALTEPEIRIWHKSADCPALTAEPEHYLCSDDMAWLSKHPGLDEPDQVVA